MEVIINKNTFLFIVVDMSSKATIVSELVFEPLREPKYRLRDGFQDEGSVLATRFICLPISHKLL